MDWRGSNPRGIKHNPVQLNQGQSRRGTHQSQCLSLRGAKPKPKVPQIKPTEAKPLAYQRANWYSQAKIQAIRSQGRLESSPNPSPGPEGSEPQAEYYGAHGWWELSKWVTRGSRGWWKPGADGRQWLTEQLEQISDEYTRANGEKKGQQEPSHKGGPRQWVPRANGSQGPIKGKGHFLFWLLFLLWCVLLFSHLAQNISIIKIVFCPSKVRMCGIYLGYNKSYQKSVTMSGNFTSLY